jgi:hypothetical protein
MDCYTHCEDFQSLTVNLLDELCIGTISFIVIWDIVSAAYLPLLACKEPPCDGIDTQSISQVSSKHHQLKSPRLLRPSRNFSHCLQ